MIGFGAVCLTSATQVQLGLPLNIDVLLILIFFATILDYNLHSFLKAKLYPDAILNKQSTSASNNLFLVKLMILVSFTGLLSALFYVSLQVISILIMLSIPTILYSLIILNSRISHKIKKNPIVKIALLAFTWSNVTIVVPIMQSTVAINRIALLMLFVERVTFIFALAIPFDIRDKKHDTLAGIKTIPIAYGEKRALLICNSVLIASMMVALIHYSFQQLYFILPANLLSVLILLILINNKAIKHSSWYYHGMLDGSILLHGLLLSLSFYLKS